MRHIHEKRNLVEHEGHEHAVKRGWRGKLHFENMPWLVEFLKWVLRVTFTTPLGVRNALDIGCEEVEFEFADLPESFDGVRILFAADLHVDCLRGVGEAVRRIVEGCEYDYCVLGGDYSFMYDRAGGPSFGEMREIARWFCGRSRVFGVLGNHDRYVMAEMLCGCGVEMLMNEHVCIERGGERIYVAGVDDCHYYGATDVGLADGGISKGSFKIMVSHSPEPYKSVAKAGYRLQLSGHSHGGQICLPGGVPLVTCATVPRRMVRGKWEYHGLSGYTSAGAGVSGVAVRYFCRPEITVVVLRRKRG